MNDPKKAEGKPIPYEPPAIVMTKKCRLCKKHFLLRNLYTLQGYDPKTKKIGGEEIKVCTKCLNTKYKPTGRTVFDGTH